ncbi:hypothetical protein LshimejAT787_1900190 [Lyophyllum shimeji]|uniref:Uncharacterized protein n=1 Tax=Lyophyllum shimeji TaxID=47721 RepID=A0A9P3Q1F5_LYOSH|nr:hypothetical protein LshimejAT787_1900190 [Lyophyllum shimeji]
MLPEPQPLCATTAGGHCFVGHRDANRHGHPREVNARSACVCRVRLGATASYRPTVHTDTMNCNSANTYDAGDGAFKQ